MEWRISGLERASFVASDFYFGVFNTLEELGFEAEDVARCVACCLRGVDLASEWREPGFALSRWTPAQLMPLRLSSSLSSGPTRHWKRASLYDIATCSIAKHAC